MNKGEVYIGMVVYWEDNSGQSHKAIVTNKNESGITISANHYGTALVHPESLVEDRNFRDYNKRIRELNATINSRFDKNSDQDLVFEDGSHVFFTSDTHFSHKNIIRFCDRPFKTTEEMDEMMIEAWNNKVGPDDVVFHLGDFCWGGSENWNRVLDRLDGHIHLIVGNHDVKNIRQGFMKHFDSICFQRQIVVEGRHIYLNHYPLLTWGGLYRDDQDKVWQLFGHVHSRERYNGGADSFRLQYLLPQQMDVGVDSTEDFAPYSWKEVKEFITAQEQIEKAIEEIDIKTQLDRMQEVEHLKLKNQLMYNMLTAEQRKEFESLITDKGE